MIDHLQLFPIHSISLLISFRCTWCNDLANVAQASWMGQTTDVALANIQSYNSTNKCISEYI